MTTSQDNQHDPARPWDVPTTPLPSTSGGIQGYRQLVKERNAVMRVRNRLHDLAPEMAEAILANYAPCGTDDPEMGTPKCSDHDATWPQQCDYHESAPKLYDLAVKLRALAADQETNR